MKVRPPGADANATDSFPSTGSAREEDVMHEPVDQGLDALAGLAVGHHHRPAAAHAERLPDHQAEVGADIGSKVDLVDDQNVRPDDARAFLAGDIIAIRRVD